MTSPNSFSDSDLAKMFPEYRLELEWIGRIGSTYKAIDEKDSEYFLKVMAPNNLEDYEILLQIENEAIALSKLNHKGFLRFVESGSKMGVPYILTEWINAIPLNEVFQFGSTSFEETALILSNICESLAHMHNQGMTHFGVKPSNIIANLDGDIKLLQLGQTRFLNEHRNYARPLATPGYTAPEVGASGENITPLCDQYSCGSLLFEMLTGSPPQSPNITASQLVNCPSIVDQIIEKSCNPDPLKRFSSIGEMGDILNKLGKGEMTRMPINAVTTLSTQPNKTPSVNLYPIKKKSSVSLMPILIILILVIGGILGFKELKKTYTPTKALSKITEIFEIPNTTEPTSKIINQLPQGFIESSLTTSDIEKYKKLATDLLISEKFEGVQLYLIKPKGEIKGVIASIPFRGTKGWFIKNFSEFNYLQKAHAEGYAIISWLSPARKWVEGSDYGINDSELTEIQRLERTKRWQDWIPRIDEGISELCSNHNLPTNGFIARVDCLSSARISRYVDAHPERFSAILYDKPHSLNTPKKEANHIFSLLISPSDEPYYPFGLNFFTKAKKEGYPVIYQVMNKDANIKENLVVEFTFDYLLKTKKKLNILGTLTNNQIQQLADKFKTDIAKSEYFQDTVNEGLYSSEEAIWVPEEQQSKIPLSLLSAYWEWGVHNIETSQSTNLSVLKPGSYQSIKSGPLAFKSLNEEEFEIVTTDISEKKIKLRKNCNFDIQCSLKPNNLVKELRFEIKSKFIIPSLQIEVFHQNKWIQILNNCNFSGKHSAVRVTIPIGCSKLRIKSSTGSEDLILGQFVVGNF